MSWLRLRRTLAVLFTCVAALAGSVLISACGGSSPKSKDGIPNKQEAQADAVKFAKCMREHGIEAEASTNGGGISIHVHASGPPKGGSEESGASQPTPPPGIEAAQDACQKYLPNEGKPPKLSPAEEAKQREAALKFARCMRSHGVDIPDPNGSEGIELGSNVDPQSATFQAAQKACQGLIGKVPLRVRSSRVDSGSGPQLHSETSGAGG